MARTSTRKIGMLVAGALPLTLVALWAHAGEKRVNEVIISTATRYAFGSIGAARNSTDVVQYIGCYTFAYSAGGTTAYCSAKAKGGVTAVCSTTSPALISAVAGVNGDSAVSFYWDAAGNCTEIDVTNFSMYQPKNP